MMQDVSGYCFKLMSIVLDGNFWILIHELVQLHTPSHNKRIVRKLFHPDDLLVIFVLNITHNLFNQIFDGDHAGCSTILVYNNGHRTVALSEFRKKVFRFLTGGNKLHGPQDLTDRVRAAKQIVGEHNANDIIYRISVHRNFGVTLLYKCFFLICHTRISFNSNDIRTRHHRLLYPFVGEFKHIVQDLRIIVIDLLTAATFHQFTENHLHILSPEYLFTPLLAHLEKSDQEVGSPIAYYNKRPHKSVKNLDGDRNDFHHVIGMGPEDRFGNDFTKNENQNRSKNSLNQQNNGF